MRVLAQGVGAVLYHRRFFDDDFMETDDLSALILGEDDVWISGHLAKNHIPRIHLSLDREGKGMAKPIAIGAMSSGSGVDSLSWHEPNKRRAQVLQMLRMKMKVFLPTMQSARDCFQKNGCAWDFAQEQCQCDGHQDL